MFYDNEFDQPDELLNAQLRQKQLHKHHRRQPDQNEMARDERQLELDRRLVDQSISTGQCSSTAHFNVEDTVELKFEEELDDQSDQTVKKMT